MQFSGEDSCRAVSGVYDVVGLLVGSARAGAGIGSACQRTFVLELKIT